MNRRNLKSLAGFAMALFVAGCGGSGTVPQSLPQSLDLLVAQVRHSGSWMLPEAKNENLFYISDGGSNVYVFSYSLAQLVGKLTGFDEAGGLCSDHAGNVWIPDWAQGTITEYAHGGSEPISTLYDPGVSPADCSIDATTGNLAVVGFTNSLAIYTGAKGAPHTYKMGGLGVDFLFCTYDGSGNLFVDGIRPGARPGHPYGRFGLSELPKGNTRVRRISLRNYFEPYGGWQLQWDGTYLAIAEGWNNLIPRFAIRGNVAHYVDTVKLDQMGYVGWFWIHGSKIIGVQIWGTEIQLYHYPAGGDPLKTLANLPSFSGDEGDGSVTVSIAPHLTGITQIK
jgi:hypothetical protein